MITSRINTKTKACPLSASYWTGVARVCAIASKDVLFFHVEVDLPLLIVD
jgi:hypothetical protein